VPRLSADSQRVVIAVAVVVLAAEQISDCKLADDQIRVYFLFLRGHRRHQKIRVKKSGGAKSEVENCHFGVATLGATARVSFCLDLPHLEPSLSIF
jgi:hypothetical protein